MLAFQVLVHHLLEQLLDALARQRRALHVQCPVLVGFEHALLFGYAALLDQVFLIAHDAYMT